MGQSMNYGNLRRVLISLRTRSIATHQECRIAIFYKLRHPLDRRGVTIHERMIDMGSTEKYFCAGYKTSGHWKGWPCAAVAKYQASDGCWYCKNHLPISEYQTTTGAEAPAEKKG